jgi:hypothetical protein
MKSLKASAAYLLALALLFPTLALAQTEGRFVGVVLDPTGAVIPGATVVVKNERTGDTRTVTSNGEGRYIVPNLPPSTYTIRATSTGLAALEFTGLQLVAAQEFALDLSLTPAGITETVTVQANFQTVDMSSARIGVNVSEREISELPVNGRQMSQLMLQAPGSQNAGTGTWNDVRFSGRANNQNVIKFDGVEGSAIIDASPGNLGGQIPSPFKLQASLENVQEFRVESSSYPLNTGPAPAARSASSPSPARTRCPARCSSTTATTSSTRRTISTRPATPTAASSRSCPSRRSASTSSAARSGRRC